MDIIKACKCGFCSDLKYEVIESKLMEFWYETMSSNKMLLARSSDDDTGYMLINYCPICGEKLEMDGD